MATSQSVSEGIGQSYVPNAHSPRYAPPFGRPMALSRGASKSPVLLQRQWARWSDGAELRLCRRRNFKTLRKHSNCSLTITTDAPQVLGYGPWPACGPSSRRHAPRAQGPAEDTLAFPPAVSREGTKPKPVMLLMGSGRSQMVPHRGTRPTWLPCCSRGATTSGPVPPKGGRMPPSWIPGSGPVPPRWH